ncbi:dysbindin-like isoform X1 [Gadus chalcogrammus]|uniref:dysbindin-like isoform X1 n=1 Tax=Gadus chalcogrammus TaxID=1042646 RepID=UPI0024C2B792|nr:dysbindin-like isoform X1 [Gadus chalcogrammus]
MIRGDSSSRVPCLLPFAAETDNAQKMRDSDGTTQPLKVRERQRFFEEAFQQEADVHLSSSHLQIDCRKPPMGSISSMEVNVDVLKQMDLMDISDQEALDVFLNSGLGADDGALASPLPEGEDEDEGEEEEEEEEEVVFCQGVPSKQQDNNNGPERLGPAKSRGSSTSSGSSGTSDGGDTPLVQSDDEEVHADTVLLTAVPQARDDETEDEGDAESALRV